MFNERRNYKNLLWIILLIILCGCNTFINLDYSFEANYRFERCVNLDSEETHYAVKINCWHNWLKYYSEGQSSEKIRYAQARLDNLKREYGSVF